MGVESVDCPVSARILGIKLNVNEMVAFYELGVVIKNRATLQAYNGTWHWTDGGDIVLDHANTTLVGGVMSVCALVNITPIHLTGHIFLLSCSKWCPTTGISKRVVCVAPTVRVSLDIYLLI